MKDRKIEDEDFDKAGFDITKEPFRKNLGDGVVLVYKNYRRDGSGQYDGYCVIEPAGRVVRTVKEFLTR